MRELEEGAIANPDENRMVGHYWLRSPELAPSREIKAAIVSTLKKIKTFAAAVHTGQISGQGGEFKRIIVIGIGGSALGPLVVSRALGNPKTDLLSFYLLDNTDPDGIDRLFAEIGDRLGSTLCIVISKSGETKETRNGMIEAQRFYESQGLKFAKHAVAVTQEGSQLDKFALENGWIERFPMWDWVGGRTSELSAVGLLPAALQGFDIDNLLAGARAMDQVTRSAATDSNPSMRMALAWFSSGNGNGDRNLVVLPYKDRLELLSKYLQQLIMESIGKELDLQGHKVSQGLSVFGNKGSTDQHSFVQQLRDGRDDFIVTFIEVLKDRSFGDHEVEPGLSSGDYLQGFLLGTRQALSEKGRQSITITINEVSAFTVGSLIALFERAVGFYASLIGINAYHQPGVEAGKKAAGEILGIKLKIVGILHSSTSNPMSPVEIAKAIGSNTSVETVYKLCKRLASNPATGIREIPATRPDLTQFHS
jgi:glucose-6-phosphate isomerase